MESRWESGQGCPSYGNVSHRDGGMVSRWESGQGCPSYGIDGVFPTVTEEREVTVGVGAGMPLLRDRESGQGCPSYGNGNGELWLSWGF